MERKEHRSGKCQRTEPEGLDLALRDEGVKKALQARTTAALAKIEVNEERTLQELAAIAFSNIKDYLEWDKDGDLVVKDSADIPDALAAAIESIEEQTIESKNKDGSRIYIRTKRKIKLYPKLPALQLVSEYLGLTDSLAPKITVRLITGIVRDPPAITVEAEPDP